ncbi:unnamed protein product [Paramecium sonneborni]|uniref:Protein kinase domain-containing protein n=1 Tax=Paramecium sonneborni TaxID=65129 RepID=A0A8S1RK34_9CILI|nr:unnamed protein product [Paramecium sonneborni]
MILQNQQIFDKQHTDYIQTRFYRSSEQIKQEQYNQDVDIWAIGCILAELYLLNPFIPGTTTEIDQLYLIKNLNLDQDQKIILIQPLNLIKNMLQEDPFYREQLYQYLELKDDTKYLISSLYKYLQKLIKQENNNQNFINHHTKLNFNFKSQNVVYTNLEEDLDYGYIPSYITSVQTTNKKRQFRLQTEKQSNSQ